MSFEESILLQIMRAVNAAKLDAVVIGNAAAALHGVPVTTQDVDLFIRDTPRNAEKIDQFLRFLGKGVTASRPFEPVSRMMRIEGLPVDIDLVFELSSHAKFESVKARSQVITIEGVALRISDLTDVIDAKRAAGRPKDLPHFHFWKNSSAFATKSPGSGTQGRSRTIDAACTRAAGSKLRVSCFTPDDDSALANSVPAQCKSIVLESRR